VEGPLLLTPGPVRVHPRVLAAASKQMISHRSSEFRALFSELEDMLRRVHVSQRASVAILAGSGTTAVDAMVYSLVEPGDRVLLLSFGEFGERLRETLESRGALVDAVEAELGSAPSASEVARALENASYKALFTVYNETSTGARLTELASVAREAKKRGALVCVDAVSALAGEPLFMDEWGIDAVASCSHKNIGAPPGVAFVALSEEAASVACRTRGKPLSLDLCKYSESAKRSETPFTPAISTLYALREALDILLSEEGLEARWARIARLSTRLYAEAERLGLRPFPKPRARANAVAALELPPGLKASGVSEALRKRGVIVATGMGSLKEKILRVGVMAYVGDGEISRFLEALSKALGGIAQ